MRGIKEIIKPVIKSAKVRRRSMVGIITKLKLPLVRMEWESGFVRQKNQEMLLASFILIIPKTGENMKPKNVEKLEVKYQKVEQEKSSEFFLENLQVRSEK